MSREVDQRVVEMRFDNKDFEKNVSETMSTLDKLKQRLNFSDAVGSFDEVTAAARSTDMTPLSNAVEIVHEKFSKLEVVAMAALANIANSAINTGKTLIASLSVSLPISESSLPAPEFLSILIICRVRVGAFSLSITYSSVYSVRST